MAWKSIYLPLSDRETALLGAMSEKLEAYVVGVRESLAQARGKPKPDSELAVLLAADPAPPELEHAEMRLFAALEHLETLANALVPGNAPLIFAPFTLMRTALEAAGKAAWAWEPGLPEGEREQRGLRLRWDNLDEVIKMTDKTANAEQRATRDGLGVGASQDAVSILGKLLPQPLAGGKVGDRLYRQLGGRGHAMPWTFTASGTELSRDASGSGVLLKPNLSHLLGALDPTLEVVQIAFNRFGDLAGLTDDASWKGRPVPPSF